jgi:hypothetical protein
MPGPDRVNEVSYGTISAVFRKHKLCVTITVVVVAVGFWLYGLSQGPN